MDSNRDGVITIEEFLDCCRKDKLISDSMSVFDSTIWPLEKLHSLPAFVVDQNCNADTTESMNGYSQQTDCKDLVEDRLSNDRDLSSVWL